LVPDRGGGPAPAGTGPGGPGGPAPGGRGVRGSRVTPASAERAAFHEFIARHRRFLLTTHINPDGDGLGSETALALWLEAQGKEARILNDSVMPPAFAFFAQHARFEAHEPTAAERRITESDAVIVLDTSHPQR